jgi:hypothetical protein
MRKLLLSLLVLALTGTGAGVVVHRPTEKHLPVLVIGPSPSPMGLCPIENEAGRILAAVLVMGPRPLPPCASIGVTARPMSDTERVRMWARECSYPEAVKNTGPYLIQVLTSGRPNSYSRRACTALERTAILAHPI